MKKVVIRIAVFLPLMLSIIPVFAQGAPPATPIDGGLGLLLIVGGAYGIKKIKNRSIR